MSVDLVDLTPGNITLRRPDGSVMFNSAERNPAEAQRVSVTGLTVDWPPVSGEQNVWLPLTSQYRHEIPAHNTYATQTIAALSPAGIAPQFFLTNIKLTQTLQGRAASTPLYCRQAQNIWRPMVGSIHLESHAVYVFRAINIAAVGGNIVLEKRQMGIGYSDTFNIPSSTQSTYTMDFDIAWGIFDG